MTGQPVFGEFLGGAREHLTAAASFRGELSYDSVCDVVRQLDRLVAAMERCLADLPDPAHGHERDVVTRVATPRLALRRAGENLRHGAAGLPGTGTDRAHPAAAHLAAATSYLSAGTDLLHTHFSYDNGTRRAASFWAPVITSGPVAAALLEELAACAWTLSGWAARHTAHRASPLAPSTAHLALTAVVPWLELACTTMQAARQAHYPLPAPATLDAIPVNIPPPRQSPTAGESVPDLCQRIPVTAERLRHAAFTFAADARWSPAATSLSWRRNALACAITSHTSELILRTLAKRAAQLGQEPALQAQMQAAADIIAKAGQSWRDITSQWDILTTGTPRGCGLTPVAAEIGDLALRTGRLAYASPDWAPGRSHAGPTRHPANLAASPTDIPPVLAAVHHAADAMHHIASTDRKAVTGAADDGRLYIPLRLLPDNYDIPQPYTTAPRFEAVALLATYHAATEAAMRAATALDELATAINTPSSALAATRQSSHVTWHDQRQHNQRSTPAPPDATPLPGRTEQALLKLAIRDPALLLRAAAIDHAAHDLLSEAQGAVRSRASSPRPRLPGIQKHAQQPAQLADQDTPRNRRKVQPTVFPSALAPAPRGSSRRSVFTAPERRHS